MKKTTLPTGRFILLFALFIITTFLIVSNAFAQPCMCGNGRYLNPIFGRISLGTNVQYTQTAAQNTDGTYEQETMDIWGPQGDNCTSRPVIIWVHGGGFAQQDKTAGDVVAMCDTFSRRGFVVASIDYRDDYWGPSGIVNDFSSDPTPYDSLEFTRADYRAMQDAKCAVRYFKANASLYGVDTNFIFMGGTSAGAWTSLMVGYLDKNSEKPIDAFAQTNAWIYPRPDLGSIDGIGGWNNVSSKIRGIISCWGALPDTSIIDGPNDPACILFHEYADPVVNYYYGPPFQGQFQNFKSYWGSNYTTLQMQQVHSDFKLFPLNGSYHALYPYRGLVTTEVSLFLDSIICNSITTTAAELSLENSIDVFPNPSNENFDISYSINKDALVSLELFNCNGTLVFDQKTGIQSEGAHHLVLNCDAANISEGIYLLRITTEENVMTKKIIVMK